VTNPTSPHRRRRSALLAALLALVVAGSCTSGDGDGGGATIVVSTGIWGDVVAEVVGDCAAVEVLIPPGVDPHGFELSARQAASLREADLVVLNGLGLEEQLEGAIESAEAEGVAVFEVGDELDPLPLGGGRDDEDGHDGPDPHVWQDPRRVATAAELIADEVAAATGCDGAGLDGRAAAYADAVRDADEAIAGELDAVPEGSRQMVTNHDAFAYFADRYGFEVVDTVIPSSTTLAEPGSADLAELAETLDGLGIGAVFVETIQSHELAERLAEQAGHPVEVVELYSDALGEPGSGAETYIEMMRTNARRIASALTPS
jgi:zinc/manganese transport system substrate-binding protein